MTGIMRLTDVEVGMLSELYEGYFPKGDDRQIAELQAKHGWNDRELRKGVDRLGQAGLIKGTSFGGNYEITTAGIHFVEENGLGNAETRRLVRAVRMAALITLADQYEEQGPDTFETIDALQKQIEVSDRNLLIVNLGILEDDGAVEFVGGQAIGVTAHGLTMASGLRERLELSDKLEVARGMRPQARGRRFQQLLSEALAMHGWSVGEGIRLGHEEIDVLVHKGREYYLIEAKWEKAKTEAHVVRELLGKLMNRLDTRGIVVSMSGFTQGAVSQAVDSSNQRLILLFGPNDVAEVFRFGRSFDQILDEKYERMQAARTVVWS